MEEYKTFEVKVSIPQLAAQKQEDFWRSVKESTFGLLARVVEATVDQEVEEFVGARWHERKAPGRVTTRAGRRPRRFTVFGHDVMLRLPRARIAGFRSRFLEYRKRRHTDFDYGVMELYVAGASTRETTAALYEMFGTTVSPTTVSNLVKAMDVQRRFFQTRPLKDEYAYLLFDAMYVHCLVAPAPMLRRAERGQGMQELAILLVRGIKADGTRELVDFRVARGESEDAWEQFLQSLFARGLEGQATKLFVHDGSEGLDNAIDSVYGAVRQQRCVCHKLTNVWDDVVDKDAHRALRRAASEIYEAADLPEARRLKEAFCQTWHEREPRAVATLCRDFEATLAFYAVPQEHRSWVLTTNPLERYIRELRRRLRPMGTFQGLASCQRLVYLAIRKLSNERRNAIPYSVWATQPWYGSRRRRRAPRGRPDTEALRKELYRALAKGVR